MQIISPEGDPHNVIVATPTLEVGVDGKRHQRGHASGDEGHCLVPSESSRAGREKNSVVNATVLQVLKTTNLQPSRQTHLATIRKVFLWRR